MKPHFPEEIEDLCINLHLTDRCNYRCDHCMYASGPSKPEAYMPWEVFQYLRYELCGWEPADRERLHINLVGGEPTLNLDEFERCWNEAVEIVNEFGCRLEMTTNGWWLEKFYTAKRFFDIVRDHCEQDECVVRISNSQYHARFRPQWLQQLIDRPFVFNSDAELTLADYWSDQCTECGGHCDYIEEEEDSDAFYRCQKCGEERYMDDEALYTNLDGLEYSIYVDGMDYGLDKVSATGRGKVIGGYQEPTCRSIGFPHDIFSYKMSLSAKGIVRDFCCNGGSTVWRGQVNTQSLYDWFDECKRFQEHIRARGVTCADCPQYARKWNKENPLPVEGITIEEA